MSVCFLSFSSRCDGRLRRSDFWYRILPLNVLFGIADRVLIVYYGSGMETAVKAVDAKYGCSDLESMPEMSDTQAMAFFQESLSAAYGHVLPMAGWLLLTAVLYGWITGPWYVRRLHDINMTGKWFILWVVAECFYLGLLMLSPFIPFASEVGSFGVIVVQLFLFCCALMDSQYAANRYGESPKYGRFKKAPILPPLPK